MRTLCFPRFLKASSRKYPQGYISYYYTGLANNPLSSHNMNVTFIRFTLHMII